jgi:hypothetical protein
MLSLAWKTLRGAELASTKMVTVGGAADQPQIEKNKVQATPKLLESFIRLPLSGRSAFLNRFNAVAEF